MSFLDRIPRQGRARADEREHADERGRGLAPGPVPHRAEEPVSALVSRASDQLAELVRAEMRLARAEMLEKARGFGRGGGLLGGAGLVAYVAFMGLAAAAVAALSLVLPVWAAALIVTGVLAVCAGVLAAAGRKRIREAAPPVPGQAIDGVRKDTAMIKERSTR
ncbi:MULTISPECIES: phage holin family protein [Streptomyces]|uniref:phage holin family protein n=1 Tax=Streptomyces TaxID=1883 RepID=UPI001CC9840E|nr:MULTISPECIES: phage holin family protein [Streptomyces]UBI35796.1 phage holin family protein [Streptomyces mobaraensis]UKW28389.1 phage holin family protein [Streptomyces sp. TYQ1024]